MVTSGEGQLDLSAVTSERDYAMYSNVTFARGRQRGKSYADYSIKILRHLTRNQSFGTRRESNYKRSYHVNGK